MMKVLVIFLMIDMRDDDPLLFWLDVTSCPMVRTMFVKTKKSQISKSDAPHNIFVFIMCNVVHQTQYHFDEICECGYLIVNEDFDFHTLRCIESVLSCMAI